MDELFQALRAGTRCKKKTAKTSAAAAANGNAAAALSASISPYKHASKLPSSSSYAPAAVSTTSTLDFFRSAGAIKVKGVEQEHQKRKRPRRAREEDSEEDDDGKEEISKKLLVEGQHQNGMKSSSNKKKRKKGAATAAANGAAPQSAAASTLQLFNKADNQEGTKKGAQIPQASSSSSFFDQDKDSDGNDSDDSSSHSSSSPGRHGRTQNDDDEMRAFRRRLRIKVTGENIPDCLPSFSLLPSLLSSSFLSSSSSSLVQTLLQNVEASHWKEPTPIQMQALPILLLGRDLLASSPTGTGKTAAFIIPTLLRLGAPISKGRPKHTKEEAAAAGGNRRGPRALFLAPTRELAAQIYREVERLSQGKKFKIGLLSKALAATRGEGGREGGVLGAYDVLVATPMRLVQVVREGGIDLGNVLSVVLDEADKLLELGREGRRDEEGHVLQPDKSFLGQVDEILAACSHPQVQRALFSATLPPLIEDLARSILRDPLSVSIGLYAASLTNNYQGGAAVPDTVTQSLLFVGREEGKLLALRQILREGVLPPVLVFLQTKERARELYHELCYDNFKVEVMHADRSPEQRAELLHKVRTGEVWVLLCTDICSRGLDLRTVNMVINYDLPSSCVAYVHRVGRTGRAGRKGRAVSFWTEGDMLEGKGLRSIANVIKLSGGDVPTWMTALKPTNSKGMGGRRKEGGREGGKGPTFRRERISTGTAWDRERAKRKSKVWGKGKHIKGEGGERGRGGEEGKRGSA
ncbi:rna dead-box type [Nannochloropsis oceanica]